MQASTTKYEKLGVPLFALIVLVVVPVLNVLPEGSFLHVSNFTITLYGKYLCYAVLAISVDLLWGYTGLLCLGQALFFTLGGYMMGMYLMRMIGNLGQYHEPIPDFLVFLGWSTLPAFWKPFSNFPFAVLMGLLLPGVLALVFGYLAFRSRIRGVYFSILTQALTYGACLLFSWNSLLLGGNNGFYRLQDYPRLRPAAGGHAAVAVHRQRRAVNRGLRFLPLVEPDEIRPGPTGDS